MLFYPPSKLFQRGEDRSQGNIEDSTATSIRAPNDLGYASSALKKEGCSVFLRDYQTESLTIENVILDYSKFAPDIIFVSITNTTIFDDIKKINILREKSENFNSIVILKGAIFFDAEEEMLSQLDLENIDYLIGGESDFIIDKLVKFHFEDNEKIPTIPGILYKEDGKWVKTNFSFWEENLDSLPFPDREQIKNFLYVRPDTGEPQATIVTSRGCPSRCIFCLTPKISGKRVRFRNPKNIFDEIKVCYEKQGIKNFFFRSDTFTLNKKWVKELCQLIIRSDLKGKIEWVANSKTKPLEKETLQVMKEAGCWLVAFGYESGNKETLEKLSKGTTIKDNLIAAEYAREVGLKTFGFFLIGLPWENWEHLQDTEKHIYQLKPDFLEIHLAVPYSGTELYEISKKEGVIDENVLGKDYFNEPMIGTKYISINNLQKFRRKIILNYHFSPHYMLRRFNDIFVKPKVLKSYFTFGVKLLKKNLLHRN